MVEWLDNTRFVYDSVEFSVAFDQELSSGIRVFKPRCQIEPWVNLLQASKVRGAVELGIKFGGSVALLAMIAKPEKLLAFELATEPAIELEAFIAERQMEHIIHARYGVDQSNVDQILAVVRTELDGAPLDLVIDDASHRVNPTRASFEALFPLLQTNGRYIIEDWAHDITMADQIRRVLADSNHPDYTRVRERTLNREGPVATPLAAFIIELMLAKASAPEVMGDIAVMDWGVVINRGKAVLDPETFRVGDLFHDHFGLSP